MNHISTSISRVLPHVFHLIDDLEEFLLSDVKISIVLILNCVDLDFRYWVSTIVCMI